MNSAVGSFIICILILQSAVSHAEPPSEAVSATSKASSETQLTTPEAPRLPGTWKSPQPEIIGKNLYVTREIHFTLNRWDETLVFAADKDMKKETLIARAEGSYDLKKTDSEVWALDLQVSRRALNLQAANPGMLKDLKASSCGLSKKHELDISRTGCGVFPSVATCGTRFESVAQKDGQLMIGTHSPIENACALDQRPQDVNASLKHVY
jgi:hypothetical protein